ncbi:MAG: metallophosphoesterase [Clostridia bacterium]|nr:metallophosphoesterase [Clostridia bacterium]
MTLGFKNGKFKILQVSDPQDMHYPRRSMLKMLDKAYDTIKPDLVVFTGDNVLSNHLLDARFGNKKVAEGWEATRDRMRKSLSIILDPLEKRGIPFAMIFGNHDDMCCMTKEEIIDLYREYSCFVGLTDTYGFGDVGTHNIIIYSGDKPKFNLWMMDTSRQDKELDKGFEGVTAAAVEWYVEKSNSLKEQNGGKPLPSLMFQHIPVSEIDDCVEQCSADADGAAKLYDENKYIRLKPEKVNSGRLYEPTPGCKDNYGQFDAIKQQGDVLSLVYGHHHMNMFDITHDGVRMIQTPAASFRCYGNSLRGVRLFEVDENSPETFTTKHFTYFDIVGKTPASMLSYFIDADDLEKPRRAVGAALAVGAVAGAAALIVKKFK